MAPRSRYSLDLSSSGTPFSSDIFQALGLPAPPEPPALAERLLDTHAEVPSEPESPAPHPTRFGAWRLPGPSDDETNQTSCPPRPAAAHDMDKAPHGRTDSDYVPDHASTLRSSGSESGTLPGRRDSPIRPGGKAGEGGHHSSTSADSHRTFGDDERGDHKDDHGDARHSPHLNTPPLQPGQHVHRGRPSRAPPAIAPFLSSTSPVVPAQVLVSPRRARPRSFRGGTGGTSFAFPPPSSAPAPAPVRAVPRVKRPARGHQVGMSVADVLAELREVNTEEPTAMGPNKLDNLLERDEPASPVELTGLAGNATSEPKPQTPMPLRKQPQAPRPSPAPSHAPPPQRDAALPHPRGGAAVRLALAHETDAPSATHPWLACARAEPLPEEDGTDDESELGSDAASEDGEVVSGADQDVSAAGTSDVVSGTAAPQAASGTTPQGVERAAWLLAQQVDHSIEVRADALVSAVRPSSPWDEAMSPAFPTSELNSPIDTPISEKDSMERLNSIIGPGLRPRVAELVKAGISSHGADAAAVDSDAIASDLYRALAPDPEWLAQQAADLVHPSIAELARDVIHELTPAKIQAAPPVTLDFHSKELRFVLQSVWDSALHPVFSPLEKAADHSMLVDYSKALGSLQADLQGLASIPQQLLASANQSAKCHKDILEQLAGLHNPATSSATWKTSEAQDRIVALETQLREQEATIAWVRAELASERSYSTSLVRDLRKARDHVLAQDQRLGVVEMALMRERGRTIKALEAHRELEQEVEKTHLARVAAEGKAAKFSGALLNAQRRAEQARADALRASQVWQRERQAHSAEVSDLRAQNAELQSAHAAARAQIHNLALGSEQHASGARAVEEEPDVARERGRADQLAHRLAERDAQTKLLSEQLGAVQALREQDAAYARSEAQGLADQLRSAQETVLALKLRLTEVEANRAAQVHLIQQYQAHETVCQSVPRHDELTQEPVPEHLPSPTCTTPARSPLCLDHASPAGTSPASVLPSPPTSPHLHPLPLSSVIPQGSRRDWCAAAEVDEDEDGWWS